jgi:hypothetical protein
MIAVIAMPAPAHAEFCGAMGLEAHVLSQPDIILPGDGGIVVAAMIGNGHLDTDVADQPTWTFRTGGAHSAPRRLTLAPGLVVYRARQDGTVTLVDADEKTRATAFVTQRPRPRLAAPVVKWTVRTPDRVDVHLELASLPPDEAIALVIVGKDKKPRSWELVDPDATHQRVYKHLGCEMHPIGTMPSHAGDEVTFFFVDAYGRTSPPSKPIKISDKTPSERRLSRD